MFDFLFLIMNMFSSTGPIDNPPTPPPTRPPDVPTMPNS